MSLRRGGVPPIRQLEERYESAEAEFLHTLQIAAESEGTEVVGVWERIKVACRNVKVSAKNLQARYASTGQISSADTMHQKRVDAVEDTKRVLTNLKDKIPDFDKHNLTMISDITVSTNPELCEQSPLGAVGPSPITTPESGILPGYVETLHRTVDVGNRNTPLMHSESSVRSRQGIQKTVLAAASPVFTPSRKMSFNTDTPQFIPTADVPFHSPASSAHACDGGYKRAEAEFLRGPRDGSMKFGDAKDNYHLFAESFEHGLSRLPQLTGINKLHALVSHTKGEARDLVMQYKNSARQGNAGIIFERVWELLHQRYGSDDTLADQLNANVIAFKPLSYPLDIDQLSKFKGLCECIQASLDGKDVRDRILIKYDEKDGLHILASKFPREYLERWQDEVLEFKRSNQDQDPDLSIFIAYLNWMFKRVTDPFLRSLPAKDTSTGTKPKRSYSGNVSNPTPRQHSNNPTPRHNSNHSNHNRQNYPPRNRPNGNSGRTRHFYCPLHNVVGHRLGECNLLRSYSKDQKIAVLDSHYACRKCTYSHPAWRCEVKNLHCDICQGEHLTVLHDIQDIPQPLPSSIPGRGTAINPAADAANAAAAVPVVRNNSAKLRSYVNQHHVLSNDEMIAFSKTQLAFIRHASEPHKVVKCLIMVDEQSRKTFVDEKLITLLDLHHVECSYQLETLAGLSTEVDGSIVGGLQVRGYQMETWHDVPPALTGGHIPDSRAERATRPVVECIPTVSQYAQYFDEEDPVPETLLLIGTDMGEAFHVTSFGETAPFVHLNIFGWSLLGEVDASILPPDSLAVQSPSNEATKVLRGSIVRDIVIAASPSFLRGHEDWNPSSGLFEERQDDDELSYSQDDQHFTQILVDGLDRVEDGRLQLPLPIKPRNDKLPSNEGPVYYRNLSSLRRALKDPVITTRLCTAMQNHLAMGHVTKSTAEAQQHWTVQEWFLPLVLVNQILKQSIRITIDGAARYQGCSLNDLLYSGPDLNNALRSVLHRLRVHRVAVTLDIRHMFNCFVVPPEQRAMLQFHWWDNNDPNRPLVPYHYTVHPFGACSSPAVAMFALKSIACIGRSTGELTDEQASFIENSFYIDDGTDSLPLSQEAIQLIIAVKRYLKKFGLEVHKINSNCAQVKQAFASDTATESIKCIDTNPIPKTLGVVWDTVADVVSVRLEIPERPFTRRGVLATVNTIFDPLGIAAPVILGGRQFQRKLLTAHPVKQPADWDEPLSEQYAAEWQQWKDEVMSVPSLDVSRCLCPYLNPAAIEMHCFADASELAISCVMYLKVVSEHNEISVTFVAACSKLAPHSASSSIPRLELVSCLLATQMCSSVCKDIKLRLTRIVLYTDSMVCLGYLKNTTKRFSKYVSRRIETILKGYPVSHWRFVSTHENPADIGTRIHSPHALRSSIWFSGPDFLYSEIEYCEPNIEIATYLPETLPIIPAMRVACSAGQSMLEVLAQHVSSWSRLVIAISIIMKRLRHLLDHVRQQKIRTRISLAPRGELTARYDAIKELFSASQRGSFGDVMVTDNTVCVSVCDSLPDNHPLSGLSPIVVDGLLRVGGRLRHLATPFEIKHPIILDSKSAIVQRFAKFCHDISPHQGRIITMNKIRSMGAYIIGGRRLVDYIIRECVTCKRLRGATCEQVMADLPSSRLCDTAPFDHVGVDVAGPFYVHDGVCTRRTAGTKKVFVLVINCLSSRAVHLEALGGMDSNSFINAIRRFMAVRGTCRSILSDHGTNFIGALSQCDDLNLVQRGIEGLGIQWRLIPVSASHHGGAYERKIASIRRVLEAMLLPHNTPISRDDFLTLLQEAAAVVNSTPLFPGSEGPGEPLAVSPSCLLTLKTPGVSPFPDEFSESDRQAYGKRRWRRVQLLAHCFWKQWRENYLQSLQRRVKWRKKKPNIREGDVVILRTKNTQRCHWPLAVVRRVVADPDDHVRKVIVAVADASGRVRETERAITDLILLFSSQ